MNFSSLPHRLALFFLLFSLVQIDSAPIFRHNNKIDSQRNGFWQTSNSQLTTHSQTFSLLFSIHPTSSLTSSLISPPTTSQPITSNGSYQINDGAKAATQRTKATGTSPSSQDVEANRHQQEDDRCKAKAKAEDHPGSCRLNSEQDQHQRQQAKGNRDRGRGRSTCAPGKAGESHTCSSSEKACHSSVRHAFEASFFSPPSLSPRRPCLASCASLSFAGERARRRAGR
ncbi:hypothetical protein BKA65DRAFT_493903 [Rhexocercosporidium sp. MPI-PUGE-AT-0058]|nr:hypothetical protein BKA65DRAFT_493903 [Rhexocercosporidium sp. MPI-PUGE-AT-0058]